eukprot:TRINITY_DN4668_c0_g1_i1.p1 TRINITY_DN4668_c0_g1~~TRINITY_DN4668_c0_g1_i1.p1  ORF type:complete len:533 (-),score=71.51 TRINITY_DN4668_c0_g1_i1:249-1847(-)
MGCCASTPATNDGAPPSSKADAAASSTGAAAGSATGGAATNSEASTGAPVTKASSGSKKSSNLTANVLGRPAEDVKNFFTIGRELGRGQFGVTYLCTDKSTGEQYACKSIAKRKLVTAEDVEDVKREVAIMHHLVDHPNVVKMKGAYEDKHSVHIVMELCAGGELFDRIIARGHYSERAAANLLRTIVSVVEYCHANGVMHRDLKPENFLLASKKEDAPLKATDFGLSIFCKPGETFSDIVGSAYYVAPEVLRRKYGPEADVWSCGVILYILLCGVPPFWAESEQGIFDAVLKGHIDFSSDPWPLISASAKELIKKMLKQDPKERLTARQVLDHPWVKIDGEASDVPLDSAVLTKLKQFSAMNKMKKLALKVIASHMSEEEIMGLKEMFKSIDKDGSGSITFEELKDGLKQLGSNMPEEQVRQLMEAADVDNSGTIDYQEFITATIHMNKVEKEENLFQAFQHFDADGSGYITVEELREALSKEEALLPGEIDAIIEEVDTDNDGRIDYNEFCAMMRKGNPTTTSEDTRRKR